MKVLIEIDDKDYADIMSDSERNLNHYERLIKKGTPLPKGHGDLVDRDALKMDTRVCGDRYLSKSSLFVANKIIEQADTIIEADKAESEE